MPLRFTSPSTTRHSAQVFFRLVSFFQLFLVLSGTFVFRYGLLGVLFSRFKYTFVMAIIGFFVTVGFRVLRVIHILDGKDVVEIWDDSLYEALFYVHCFSTSSGVSPA